jgi:hypothetical protein
LVTEAISHSSISNREEKEQTKKGGKVDVLNIELKTSSAFEVKHNQSCNTLETFASPISIAEHYHVHT